MMGYMMGKMLNRQSSSGFDARKFEQMKMSPPASQTPPKGRSTATGNPSGERSVTGEPRSHQAAQKAFHRSPRVVED